MTANTPGAQLRPREELLAMLDARVSPGMCDTPRPVLPNIMLLSEAAERIRADAPPALGPDDREAVEALASALVKLEWGDTQPDFDHKPPSWRDRWFGRARDLIGQGWTRRAQGSSGGEGALRERARAALQRLLALKEDAHAGSDHEAAWKEAEATVAALSAAPVSRGGGNHQGERCFICDERFHPGDRVLDDMSGETGHLDCFGPDRDGYVKDMDTGEPLGPDDPMPKGYEWQMPAPPVSRGEAGLLSVLKEAQTQLLGRVVHMEVDWPGDSPVDCGWWCPICEDHVDGDRKSGPSAEGHKPACTLSRIATALATPGGGDASQGAAAGGSTDHD